MNRPDNLLPSPVDSAAIPEVINHTQWPSQYFQHVDPHGIVFHVMVTRISYSLRGMQFGGVALPSPALLAAELQLPLCTTDEYRGAVNESSVLQESDYAPFKPKCDVLLANAHAYAPEGKPAARWSAGFRFGDDIEKKLQVTGPRQFDRFIATLGASAPSEPEPATLVPLMYELAYGGPNIIAHKLQLEQYEGDPTLSDAQRALSAEALKTCPDFDAFNPIGCGRAPSKLLDTAQACAHIETFNASPEARRLREDSIARLPRPSPQIEAFGRAYCGEEAEGDYPVVGVGAVGRWWLPRRALAGTHDEAWKQTQWPKSPKDHDYRYWNCAPEDQQIDYPKGGEEIVLANLTPTGSPVRFLLPSQDLRLLVRLNSGALVFAPMNIDTVIIDFAKGSLSIVRRALVSARAEVRALELGTWPAGTAREPPESPGAPAHG